MDLEGCCRIRVEATSSADAYYTATVQQLENFHSSDARQALPCEVAVFHRDSLAPHLQVPRSLQMLGGQGCVSFCQRWGTEFVKLNTTLHRHEAADLDAEGEAVLAQLRQAARQLLGMVSLTSGAAAATRLADVSAAAVFLTRHSSSALFVACCSCLWSTTSFSYALVPHARQH